jgi:hypothetical protein
MFGLIKFLISVYRAFVNLLDPNVNDLRYAPVATRYLFSIMLACFWCLAFGLWAGELYYIGYNMIGHIAVVTMAFGTWAVFQYVKYTYKPRSEYEILRDPNRQPKCYELTDEERARAAAVN